MFGSLRGLRWDSSSTALTSKETVAVIPSEMVLQSDFSDEDWDAKLATSLWQECQKASGSLSGYVALLGYSDDEAARHPAAPHALRHWSVNEKNELKSTSSGQRVLDLCDRQLLAWNEKYTAQSNRLMTLDQCIWAMEVVHSRAFRGLQTTVSSVPVVASIVAPVLSAAAAFLYSKTHASEPPVPLLAALGILAVAPALLQVITPVPQSAVLLPLIDSANHDASVDAEIQFNSVTGCFELQAGPKSLLVQSDAGNSRQLFISYGTKSDAEWLLNYGFLPGVEPMDDTTAYRNELARVYKERNS